MARTPRSTSAHASSFTPFSCQTAASSAVRTSIFARALPAFGNGVWLPPQNGRYADASTTTSNPGFPARSLRLYAANQR